jgi:hypothetical protein
MLTTAGLMRSATSAKFTTPVSDAGLGRSFGDASRAGALDTTGVRATPPARMTPTRNATDDDSASVIRVKRFDMGMLAGRLAPLNRVPGDRQTPLLSPGTRLPSAS